MSSKPRAPSTGTVLEDLPFDLVRAALALRRFNDKTLKAVGLTAQAPGLASVLHAIDEISECTVSRLVERTHLPNGTLTGLLDTLENDGCIERVDNREDGRSWRIRLTKKGAALCLKLQERHALVMELFQRTLSADETQELKRLLARVTVCMRDYSTATSSSPVKTRKPRSAAAAKKRAPKAS